MLRICFMVHHTHRAVATQTKTKVPTVHFLLGFNAAIFTSMGSRPEYFCICWANVYNATLVMLAGVTQPQSHSISLLWSACCKYTLLVWLCICPTKFSNHSTLGCSNEVICLCRFNSLIQLNWKTCWVEETNWQTEPIIAEYDRRVDGHFSLSLTKTKMLWQWMQNPWMSSSAICQPVLWTDFILDSEPKMPIVWPWF